jgi:hypothetical protein
MKNIDIPAPKFELYELVTLHWNSMASPSKIVARWYELDRQTWWYKIANDEKFYSIDVLEHRDS